MTDTLAGVGRLLNRARLLVGLVALIGVLGMHGLSTGHALPVNHVAMSYMPDAATPQAGRDATDAVASQSDCPISHIDCLATLRSIPHERYPIGAGLPFPASPASSHLATVAALTFIAGRSPPDLSLTRLCISRT